MNNNGTEKKSNKTLILIIVLAILLVAALIFGFYAWSKYTNTITSETNSTSIAKWNFKVNGEVSTFGPYDLAKSSQATVDTVTIGTVLDTVNNVVTDRIAPGTKGRFSIDVDARGSEVALQYDITLIDIQHKPQNLHFYFHDASTTSNLTSNQLDFEESGSIKAKTISGIFDKNNQSKRQLITIDWEWPYETSVPNGDVQDTADGKTLEKTPLTFKIQVVGTQRPTTTSTSEGDVTPHIVAQ